jgi:peptide/nickel transport system ATP-binding protein
MSAPVLSITNLSVDLPLHRGLMRLTGPQHLNLLQDISLDLLPGQTLGLVGESGSGKTTLARAVMGLQPISAGQIHFDGADLARTGPTPLRQGAAMMFQDPIGSLSPRMTVAALITEPPTIQRRPGPRAAQLLARVGLPPDLASRYPHQLSGGQARRVCLARALALSPRLILADEPTAGLDVSVQGEVLNLMTTLKDQDGLALMIISHNLAMLRHVSDRLAILYLGRLMETGPTDQVFAAPLHPYTSSLIEAEPQPDPRKRRADLGLKGEIPSVLRRPPGCVFHTRCPVARDLCRTETPALRAITPIRAVRCHYPQDIPPQKGDADDLVH